HHPTAIRATLAGARQRYPGRRLVAVFQPHTFTRTEALLNGFAAALREADQVLVADVFGSAREKSGTIDAGKLSEAIGENASYIDLEGLTEAGRQALASGAVVVLMSAGDLYHIKSRWLPASDVS